MAAFLIVLLIGILGYLAACTVAGMRPADMEIAQFTPDIGSITRTFTDSPSTVHSAFRAAVSSTPAMSVSREAELSILIDMRPTVLVMDGSYGLVLLASFQPSDSGTVVSIQGRKKVPFAWSPRAGAALVQAERALRMRAKRSGLNEQLQGQGRNQR